MNNAENAGLRRIVLCFCLYVWTCMINSFDSMWLNGRTKPMRKATFTLRENECEWEINGKVSLMFAAFGVYSINDILHVYNSYIIIGNLTKSKPVLRRKQIPFAVISILRASLSEYFSNSLLTVSAKQSCPPDKVYWIFVWSSLKICALWSWSQLSSNLTFESITLHWKLLSCSTFCFDIQQLYSLKLWSISFTHHFLKVLQM